MGNWEQTGHDRIIDVEERKRISILEIANIWQKDLPDLMVVGMEYHPSFLPTPRQRKQQQLPIENVQALAMKGIDYEYHAIGMLKEPAEQYTEEYRKINPKGEVPALFIDDVILTQSLPIIEYLEETRSAMGLPLLPKDPKHRAIARKLSEIINSGIQPLQNLSVLKHLPVDCCKTKWSAHWIHRGFLALESELAKVSGKYCVGDQLSMADICLVPQVMNAHRKQRQLPIENVQALAMKGIDYEYHAIGIPKEPGDQNMEEYRKINPKGEVPALFIDDIILTQSLPIIEYLEETRSAMGLPLLPKDPKHRAIARKLSEIINSGIQPLQNSSVLKHLPVDCCKTKWSAHWIHRGFLALESELAKVSGKYCVGDQLSMADICLVPQVMNAHRFEVDLSPFPLITEISNRLEKLEPFLKAAPEAQPDAIVH